MQQKAPTATVKKFLVQATGLRHLQRIGYAVSFPRVADNQDHKLSLIVFSDTGRSSDHGYLFYIALLLIDDIQRVSIFLVLYWSSHRSKLLVSSIGAADILAAGEEIYEGKMLFKSLYTVFSTPVPLVIEHDSKDMFTSLRTQKNSVDKSIRFDVNVIRFAFERRAVDKFVWISGLENLADPGTKSDSPITEAVQLALVDGRLVWDFPTADSCR